MKYIYVWLKINADFSDHDFNLTVKRKQFIQIVVVDKEQEKTGVVYTTGESTLSLNYD